MFDTSKDYKMAVTEFQSNAVQERGILLGFTWGNAGAKIVYTEAPFLYLKFTQMRFYCELKTSLFIKDNAQAISPEEFLSQTEYLVNPKPATTFNPRGPWKMKVTEEESAEVQRIGFDNNIFTWKSGSKVVQHSFSYLYCSQSSELTFDDARRYYDRHEFPEITPKEFLDAVNQHSGIETCAPESEAKQKPQSEYDALMATVEEMRKDAIPKQTKYKCHECGIVKESISAIREHCRDDHNGEIPSSDYIRRQCRVYE